MRLSECVFYTGQHVSCVFRDAIAVREALDEMFTHSDGLSDHFYSQLTENGVDLPAPPLRVITISPGLSDTPFDMNAARTFAGHTTGWLQANLQANGLFYYINSRIQGIVHVPDRDALSAIYASLKLLQGNEADPHAPVIAISSACLDAFDISRGCKENEDARVFGRFLSRNVGVIVQPTDFYLYYGQLQPPDSDNDTFFGEISQKICSSMIIGSRERMHQNLDEALNYMITQVPRVSGVHMRAIHFCKPLEMTLIGADLIDRLCVQKLRLVQQVIETENEEALRNTFHTQLDVIWDYAQQRKAQNQQELMHEITEYIDRNLSDTSLSIQTIAENFRIHPTKLSALFRDYYHETIPAMIHEKRISYIRHELLHSTLTVKEIALNAGYISIATMNRAFLKSEGLYPGQYRKKLRPDSDTPS